MLPTCAFFCQCCWSFFLFQTSEFHLVWSNGSVAQASLCCRRSHLHYLVLIMLLLPIFHGFSPVYITEHIQKYCSIENFIKLPFQRVLIHLNRSPNEGVMAVLFPLLHAVQKFQNVQPSVIRPYPLVGTFDWLDSWFVGSVTSWAYKYPKISCCSPLRLCRNWWEQKLLVKWSEYVDDLDLVVSGALHRVSFGFLSPHHYWTSE
jgi:hypothetical protein